MTPYAVDDDGPLCMMATPASNEWEKKTSCMDGYTEGEEGSGTKRPTKQSSSINSTLTQPCVKARIWKKKKTYLHISESEQAKNTQAKRTEQFRAIPTGNTHQFLDSTWVKIQIGGDIIDFVVNGCPSVVWVSMQF